MSTMDNRRIHELLNRDHEFDRLRSITEEECEVIMRAKRISQRKINRKPKTVVSSLNHTRVSRIKSFFTA